MFIGFGGVKQKMHQGIKEMVLKQEGRGQGTTFKRMTQPQDMTKTGQNQLDPRWRKIQLPVDLEPHYMLIVIYQLNDTPTSAMTVLRPTIKGPKVDSDPVPGHLCPFPPNSWNNPPTHQSMKLLTPIKTDNPVPWGLLPSEMAHTLWSMYLPE